MKSKIKFTKYFGGKPTFSFRFASAHDTPGISTPSTARFIAKVTWPKLSGSGGSVEVTYSSNASTPGLTIDNTEGGSVTITRTDGSSVNAVQEMLNGTKNIIVEGGWYDHPSGKNIPFAGGNETDAKLAMPKQELERLDCMYLNYTKKINLAINERNLLDFTFEGDYVGLQSEDVINVVKGKKYQIVAYDTNFELDNETHAFVNQHGRIQIRNSAPVNTEIGYTFGSTNQYSGTFKVIGVTKSANDGFNASNLGKMITSKHKMSSSQYDDFPYQSGSGNVTLKIFNKVFGKINLLNDFKIHGNADFADYSNLVQLNCNFNPTLESGVTELKYVFAKCKKLKYNQYVAKMNYTGATSLEGYMSGTENYLGKINNASKMIGVENLSYMFEYSKFNKPIGGWTPTSATTFEGLFEGSSFNQPIKKWCKKLNSVTTLKNMFKNNSDFNQNIDNWGKFTLLQNNKDLNLEGLFHGATSFDKPVTNWKRLMPKVTSLKNTFNDATTFNQTMDWGKKINANKLDDITNFLKNTIVTGEDLLTLNHKVKNATGYGSIFNGNDTVSDAHKSPAILKREQVIQNQESNTSNGNSGLAGSGHEFASRNELNTAIDAWNANSTLATSTYGDINTWDVSAITDFSSLFMNKTNIQNLDLSNWETSQVTTMFHLFYGCTNLKTLNINAWDTSSLSDLRLGFIYCSSIETLNLNNWNVSGVNNLQDVFNGMTSLKTLNIADWNVQNVVSLAQTFMNCTSLKNLDISNWNVKNVIQFGQIFDQCSSLTNSDVDFTKWCINSCIENSNSFGPGHQYYSHSNIKDGCHNLTSHAFWNRNAGFTEEPDWNNHC